MFSKKFLVTAGIVAVGVIAYEVFTSSSDDGNGGTSDGLQPTVGQSLATSAKVGGAVLVGGGVSWLLLLLFP